MKAVFKEYFLYQRIKKLHHTVRQLGEKFDELSAKLNRKNLQKLVDQFEKAAVHAMRAALVLFQTLSFLAHGEAEDVLVGLSSALTEDPIDKLKAPEWYGEAKEAVIGSVDAVGTFLNSQGRTFFNAIDGAFEWVEEHETALAAASLALAASRLAQTMKELQKTKSPRTSPKKIAVVILGLLGGGAVLHVVTDGQSTRVVNGLVESATSGLPGANPKDAENRGQIYGNALGALFFDHGLIGSESALGRLAKHDKLAKRTRKHVKHGILMPLLTVLLQRYVVFFRRALGHDGNDGDFHDLLADLGASRTDRPGLQRFDEFQRSETGTDVHDMMSTVLNIDRFLESEVRDRWSAKWGSRLATYEQDLRAFRDDASSLGVVDLMGEHAPIVGYTLLTQLRVAVRSIRQAFELMAEKVDVALDDGSDLSILRFVEMLGFDLGDLDAVAREFDEGGAVMTKEFKTS